MIFRFFISVVVLVTLMVMSVDVSMAQVSIKEAVSGVSDELEKAIKERDSGTGQSSTFGNLPALDVEDDTNVVALVEYTLVDFVINPIFFLAAGVAIFMCVWAAQKLLIGTLVEDEITKAKKTLTWALVGLALITFSYTLVRNLTQQVIKSFAETPATTQTQPPATPPATPPP